jgi:hypothetical protein
VSLDHFIPKCFLSLVYTPSIGLWYPKGANPTLVGFFDSNFAGSLVDRKSTSGACHLLGHSLVSRPSKKQNLVALSTAEAEYIAVGSCGTQILYLKPSLVDYNIKLGSVPLLCDNESAVKIAKTQFYTHKLCTLISAITFYVENKPMETLHFKTLDPKSNWRISSQNL